MEAEPSSLRSVFDAAEGKRQALEGVWDTNSATYQDKILAAITEYEQSSQIADRVSLFSHNESLEDVSSHDLRYLLIDYRIADLVLRQTTGDRKAALKRGQAAFERFLGFLDAYSILSSSDARLFEQYRDAPDDFSTASTTDPTARRNTKVNRFREEKELKQKLHYLQQNPLALQNDDDLYRRLRLAEVAYCTHQAFQSLESIAQELHILSLAPPPDQRPQPRDVRERGSGSEGYSERLDAPLSHLSAGMSGPMLSRDGKPLRPFTLLDTRQSMQQGVFRPGHSLPTMTIDEYLEEEKRRGGMIEGGGPQSGQQPEPDEDDLDKADEETMKARAWDEFVENNPKGSGNTLNRG